MVSIIAVSYFHPATLIYLSLIIFSYISHYIINNQYNALKQVLVHSLLSILFIIPNITNIFQKLIETIFKNVGDFSPYGQIAKEMVQYTPPGLFDYIGYIGSLLLVLLVFSLISIMFQLKKHSQLLILFITSLLMSFGTWFHIYVPTNRMQAYLFLPLVLLVSIYLSENIFSNKDRYVLYILSMVIILSVFSVLKISPWFALWHGETEIGNYLNNNYVAGNLYFFERDLIIEHFNYNYPSSIVIEDRKSVV